MAALVLIARLEKAAGQLWAAHNTLDAPASRLRLGIWWKPLRVLLSPLIGRSVDEGISWYGPAMAKIGPVFPSVLFPIVMTLP